LPYIELLYKYLPGSGYNLSEHRDSEDCKPGSRYENDKVKPKNTRNNKADIAKFLKRVKS